MSCDFETTTEVYIGHDNAVVVIPYSDITERINYDMTEVTEVTASADLTTSVIEGDDITASSADVPITVWWTQVDVAGTLEWRIYLKVGLFVGITAGEYKVRIVIIDPTYSNGLVLADDLLVDVVDVP